MKFGYRDRIILLIACVIIIFGIGIFVFIKPKYEQMQKDKKAADDAKNTWNTQLLEFDQIETKQNYINKRYDEAYDMSLNFTDEMDATKLDQFIQTFFNTDENIKNGSKLVGGFGVTDEGTSALAYYYYAPSIVTYPLYEYADLDGSLAKAAAEKRKESDTLSQMQPQTVGAGSASFTVKVNKKDAFEFIDGVKKYADEHKDAMLITSISFAEYDFNGEPLERDDDGKIVGTRPTELKKASWEQKDDDELGYTDVTISYNVFYMQEPTKPDVGDKYDKTVWDTDAWREFKLPTTEQAAE